VQQRIRADYNLGHVQFFRTRLLISNSEQIAKLVDNMEKESNSIRQEALQLSWYMRGGLNYDQALQLSVGERKIINEIVKGNLETTKKSGLPFF
jgi:hypothetical protein